MSVDSVINRDTLNQMLNSGLVEGVAFRCGHCFRLSPLPSHECYNEGEEFEVEKVYLGGKCGWLVTIKKKESYVSKNSSARYHSTEMELQFLRRIGGWRNRTVPSEEVRMFYLKGYLKGALLRQDWVTLDREVVLEYVRKELGEEVEEK